MPDTPTTPAMTRYFHAGPRNLRRGDSILPSAVTGAPTAADFGAGAVCRRDRVYLTTDYRSALCFAALHPDAPGRVYEVEPVGEVTPDPDCTEPGLSFEAERALIVRTMGEDRRFLLAIRARLLSEQA